MRLIRGVLVLLVLVIAGVLAYNYWTGNGWTLQPPTTSATGVNAETAREKGADLARKAADTTKVAAERTSALVGEAALTAKIKSKMALDDIVEARRVDVTTRDHIVTLSGTVRSVLEHDRALQLAKETDGVTQVIDRLKVSVR